MPENPQVLWWGRLGRGEAQGRETGEGAMGNTESEAGALLQGELMEVETPRRGLRQPVAAPAHCCL